MKQYVVCLVQNSLFGFPINRVREIIRMTDTHHVGKSNEHMLGMINLRGQAVPVFDLASALGMESTADQNTDRVVIINDDDEQLYGWRVNGVEEVLSVEDDQIHLNQHTGAANGVINCDGEKLISVLDTFRVPASEVVSA